ncbi:MAG: UDP-N-acetylmuramoyl-L-alanine--D-glutamate ligase [Elusimicrobiota bacterium]|nr:UDP-N-acetylmuramoyl-L-alanine--D-glutamate ligase [Elusimicrobiota bacterium]
MFNFKKVSIIGLGRTGVSIANFLHSLKVEVFISEILPEEKVKKNLVLLTHNIQYETGKHSERILEADIIVKSPGVADDLPILIQARKKRIKVISELELSWSFIHPKKTIAITGTNGKTTTTALLGEIFHNAGFHTIVAGNIGSPLSDFIDKITNETYLILEVSSYQLQNIESFKPDISCILNITEDHLEHHKSMKNYISAKARIFVNQTGNDCCILNYDDKTCQELARKIHARVAFFSQEKKINNGVYYEKGNFFIGLSSERHTLNPILKIPGKHNIENALAAVSISVINEISPRVIEKTLSEFEGVEHRLEFVRNLKGVLYINDSKSTNVSSTRCALESFNKNIILIMGGRGKGFSYRPLRKLVSKKVKALLLIGEAAEEIEQDLKGTTEIFHCQTLENAVIQGYKIARPNNTVLLSPGCSSFDQFENFEERGRQFKELVCKLTE